MSRKHEDATPTVPPPKLSPTASPPPKAARLYPVLSLLSVTLLFLSAGAGISLSAVVLFRNLESKEVLDPLSRAVFFVASCMSLIYVFTHIAAARTAYIKNYGSPAVYGKYVAGFGFLLARLGLPVWVAAITFAIFVAVNVGLDTSKGIRENLPWLNVIISISSLFSLAAVLAVIEMADRPFATIGLSQSWFVRGEDPLAFPDENDMEPGIVELGSSADVKDRKSTPEVKVKMKGKKQEKRKRKTLTKKNPHEAQQHRTLRHARSMSMPTPLNTVFSDRPFPQLPDSPSFQAAFAWKPPTREETPRITGAMAFEDLGAWRERVSLRHAASDISTSASAPSNDLVLPAMPSQIEYSPRSQALLEQQRKYDLRRWTAIGMQSPPLNGSFRDLPTTRPLSPFMTMEDEHRMMGRRPSTRDGDWEAGYHLRMAQNSRPSSSHTSTTSRTSRYSRPQYTTRDDAPSIPYMASFATRVGASTNSIRPDSDVLPNEGRRRRRLSNSHDGLRLTYRTDSRALSQTYRPSSQHPSIVTVEQRPSSPTSTVRSDVHNFSRPRTSAAARMQSKVARRLRAIKQQQASEPFAQSITDQQVPWSPSTSSTPGTPRTTRAAAVRNLQERLGRRNQPPQQLVDDQRPPSPETPRTARATAVRTLQEKLGKRMMRRQELEAMGAAV
ncbi:hypothetical protein CSOJ01_03178 [Colletotrichum sojae]|uniref:Uncharacterized protein n=1 Tax=Colletotrichum sojae TaxID=2175907 RepID=A0A8H6JN93_9PEZI|nr:hypothetical protein CSOJ01_03178 [Colletotrichum sojae]